MSLQNSNHPRPVHQMVRLSYLQGLLAHRRALLIGDNSDLASFMVNLRVRHVIAIAEQQPQTPWPERENAPGQELQIMGFDDLRFRDGAFDIAVIQDLTTLANPTVVLNEVRRVIGSKGHALVAAPNPACELRLGPPVKEGALDYYVMYDLLAAVFPSVQMVGQSPFVGYAVADLASDDSDLSISFDADLQEEGSEEIEWFLAVCGEEPAELDPYSIIQVPLKECEFSSISEEDLEASRMALVTLQAEYDSLDSERKRLEQALSDERSRADELEGHSGHVKELEEQLNQNKLELGNRGVRIETLENDLELELRRSEEARARGVQIAKDFDNERKAAQKKQLEDEYARRTDDMALQTKVQESAQQIRQAEERAISAEASRDDLVDRMRADAAELDRLREKLDGLEEKNEELSKQEKSLKDKKQELEEKVSQANTRAEAAEAKQTELSSFREEIEQDHEVLSDEIASLEGLLREKSSAFTEAEAELKRRETIVRDLVVQLDKHEQSSAETDERGDKLEVEIAALNGARLGQYRARVEAELALATAEAKLQGAEVGLIEARQALEQKEETQNAIEAELRETRQALEQKEETQNAIEAELRETRQALEQKEEALGAVSTDVASTATELETSLNHIADLEGKLQAAEWKTAELEAREKDTKEQLEQAQIKVGGLSRDLDQQGQETKALEEKQTAQQDVLKEEQEARLAANKLQAEFAEKALGLEEQLKESLERGQGLDTELNDVHQQLDRFKSALESETEERKNKTQLLEHAEHHIDELEGDLKRVQSQIDDLTASSDKAGELTRQLEDERHRCSELSASLSETTLRTETSVSERDGFEKKCQKLEAELAEAKEQHEAYEQQLKSVETEHEITIGALTEKRDTAVQKSLDIEDEAVRLRDQIDKLKHDLKAEERRSRLFEEGADHDSKSVKEKTQDLAEATQRINELESNVAKSAEDRTRLENELSDLLQHLEESNQKKGDVELEVVEKANQVKETDARYQATKTELEGALAQIDAQKEAAKEIETNSRRETIDELENANNIAQLLEKKLADAEKKLANTEEKAEKETKRYSDLKAELHMLRDELDSEATRTRQAGADAARVTGEADDLKRQVAERDQTLAEWTEKQKADEKMLIVLRDEVSNLEEKVDKSIEALSIEQEKSQSLGKDLEHIETLEKDAEQLRGELDNAHNRNESAKNELAEAENKVETLEREIENALPKTETFRQELADAKKLIETLERELAEARPRAEALVKQDLLEARLLTETAERELGNVRSRAEKTEQELSEARKRSATLEQQLEGAEKGDPKDKEKLDAAQSLIQTLSEERDQAQARIMLVEGELNEANQRLSQTEEKIVDAAQAQVDISEKLGEAVASRKRLEAEMVQAVQSSEDARLKALEAEKKIAELEVKARDHLDSQDAVEQLKQELSNAHKALEAAGPEPGEPEPALPIADQAAIEELSELKEVVKKQTGELEAISSKAKDQEALLGSATAQIEEREQRATRLERQVRELHAQIKEHESDIAAWEMELKFRNTRISQLETETAKLQERLASNAPPPSPDIPIPPPLPSSDKGNAMNAKISQLNEALNDKNAEVLVLHGRVEESLRRLEGTHESLKDLLKTGQIDSSIALQFQDLVDSTK